MASPLARRASRWWWRRRPSYYDKKLAQNILRIHLNNGRQILVYEEDAADALERLGLGEFVRDWTLNLERDVGLMGGGGNTYWSRHLANSTPSGRGPLEVNLGMLKRSWPAFPVWVGNPDRYAGKRQIVSVGLGANF